MAGPSAAPGDPAPGVQAAAKNDVDNGLSLFRSYGSSLAHSNACAAVPISKGCYLYVGPGQAAFGSYLTERASLGGQQGTGYLVVQQNGKPVAVTNTTQGALSFRSQNPILSDGSAIVFNIDRTHFPGVGSTQDFSIVGVNTYGVEHNARDNMGVLSVTATSKGAQIGGTINATCIQHGEGDCVLLNLNGSTNGGATSGDQEGLEQTRGSLTSSVTRYSTTITSAATLDDRSGLYAVNTNQPLGSYIGPDPLGLWQTILNLNTGYNKGNIASFGVVTLGGNKWLLATGDAGAGFLAKYGASVIQPITATSAIMAVKSSETLPTRTVTTVAVASTAGYPSHGVLSVASLLTYEPGVPFTVVDRTHITIATLGDAEVGTLLAYGGATGLALSMDNDIIAANSEWGNGSTVLRPKTTRVVGTDASGNLILWNPGKTGNPSWDTRALIQTKFPAPTIALTTAGGRVTAGAITQTGSEYLPRPSTGAIFDNDYNQRAPSPAVQFSGDCDAAAHVDFYQNGRTLLVGALDPASGYATSGRPSIVIDTPGTRCSTRSTATLQSVFPNPYHLYEFAVAPTFYWYTDAANGVKHMSNGRLYLSMNNPAAWPSGSSLVSEVWPHIRLQQSGGLGFYNYANPGARTVWNPLVYTGMGQGDIASSVSMGDVVTTAGGTLSARAKEFAQRGLPSIYGVQGFRAPAGTGMQYLGMFANTLKFTAPNGYGSPGNLTYVTCAGYVRGCAGVSSFNLFNLPNSAGEGANQMTYDPVTGHILYGNSLGLKAGRLSEPLTTPASSSSPCSVGEFWDDANYHYVCTATNTIKRVALSTF